MQNENEPIGKNNLDDGSTYERKRNQSYADECALEFRNLMHDINYRLVSVYNSESINKEDCIEYGFVKMVKEISLNERTPGHCIADYVSRFDLNQRALYKELVACLYYLALKTVIDIDREIVIGVVTARHDINEFVLNIISCWVDVKKDCPTLYKSLSQKSFREQLNFFMTV